MKKISSNRFTGKYEGHRYLIVLEDTFCIKVYFLGHQTFIREFRNLKPHLERELWTILLK